MNMSKIGAALIITTLFSGAAMAQGNVQNVMQRDLNQQQRIHQGLKSGQLTVQEAAELQRQMQQLDKMQARAMQNGNINGSEQARLKAARDHVSQNINAYKNNRAVGNPYSHSSLRMQASIQRDIQQTQRVKHGIKTGSLTVHEAARLEHGQSRIHRKVAHDSRNGHYSAHEHARIQHTQNHHSRDIYDMQHNGRTAR